jgi:hypothetical protein
MSGMKRRNSTFCQSINCAVERQEQPARSRLAASESDRRATPETQCPRQDLGDEVTVEQDILQSAPQVVLPSLAPVAMADPLERGVELSHARPFSVRKTVNGTVPLSNRSINRIVSRSVLHFHTTRGVVRGKMPSAARAMVLLLVVCAGSVFGKVI